jgi:hypothetical protein
MEEENSDNLSERHSIFNLPPEEIENNGLFESAI